MADDTSPEPWDFGHEQIVLRQDVDAGYRAIIALHSTVLGPAVGGTRLWSYDSTAAALVDALRLSREMTYKNAAAGLALGGGKAVIISPPDTFDREQRFLAHGRAVDRLGGRFITAEDVGTTPADFEVAARQTPWVAGIDGRGGDPSPWTARGVMAGLVAGAANNPLAADRHAVALAERDILYAPDFVINAGGVISGSVALLDETHDAMVRRVDGIGQTIREVLEQAAREGITTVRAAELRAEHALDTARKERT